MQHMIKTVKKYILPHKSNDFKPHLLRGDSVTAIFLIGFVLFCTSLGSNYLINRTNFGATVLSSVLVDLTNEHRLQNNSKTLTVNPLLEKAALMKAKDMADNQYFAHTSPSGVTPWQWFTKAGYNFSYAGENLAINFTESVDVEKAWINSPTHNANLINDKFDEIGIATYQGMYQNKPTTFVVQLFGRQNRPRKDNTIAKTAVNTLDKKPINTVSAKTVNPEVKGESITVSEQASKSEEQDLVVILDEPTFSIVQNIASDEAELKVSSPKTKYSTFSERLLVNQSRYIQYIYLGLISLVYIVLILMIVIEFRTQHFKNIILGILLLAFLGLLAYLNSGFVLSFF